jgi:phosphoglycolate phosphatase-like HAD superfamily hydrolase
MIVCLFDIDGTLIASGGAGKVALERGFAEEFGREHVIEKMSLSGRTDRAIVQDLLRLADLPVTEENTRRVQVAYLRHLPECLASLQGRVLPGIAELLRLLHPREDVLVGLLTGNIRAGAKVKLGHFGLYDYFQVGGFGDVHLDRDDVAREAFADARRHLERDLDAQSIWVVGDTPLDVRCARAIGAKVLAVATGWHDRAELEAHAPDLLLDDLSDPSPLLARW